MPKRLSMLLLLATLCACASQPSTTDAKISCRAAMAGCKKQVGGTCVMLRFRQNPTCDAACQKAVKRKIQSAGVTVWHETRYPNPEPAACVGYRPDIGGTEEGAKCLAKLTGYPLSSEKCNGNGWAYSVTGP